MLRLYLLRLSNHRICRYCIGVRRLCQYVLTFSPLSMSSTKCLHADMVLEDVTELYVAIFNQRSRLIVLADPNLLLVIIAGPIRNCPKFC